MSTLQNIYINSNGELNTDCIGRLASLSDLENAICEGNEEINGLLQLSDGQYKWQSVESQRKILELDTEIIPMEIEEILQDYIPEYIKISSEVPKLYTQFINYLDLELEEIISTNFCAEEPLMLIGITKMYNSQFVHVLNFWEEYKTKKIMTSDVILPKFMLETV